MIGPDYPVAVELRLQNHVVPYGDASTFCRIFSLHYSTPAHITGFELKSVGYPYGKLDPTGAAARPLVLLPRVSHGMPGFTAACSSHACV